MEIRKYIRWNIRGIILYVLCTTVFMATFAMYKLPLKAVVYPAAICIFFTVVYAVVESYYMRKKHQFLLKTSELPASLMEIFPEKKLLEDEDYQLIIEKLKAELRSFETQESARYRNMMDYYTIWVHQIKTPIAAMRLILQNKDSETARLLKGELQRIEQYVEMVLAFIRLDSDSSDYLIKNCSIDTVVRESVKKYSVQFIGKKLYLDFTPSGAEVLTDEKWLGFVIEQILSNSLKYTFNGGITIAMDSPQVLRISDTGIGVDSADLPRIFDSSFTGYNGRRDKKASGLGLYLCRRICDNLGHEISAESIPGKGTDIRITFKSSKNPLE